MQTERARKRDRPQRRSGLHLFPDQLPLVDGAAAVPFRRAMGRRRDRRGQPGRPRARATRSATTMPGSRNGTRMGDIVEARGRDAAKAGHTLHRRRLPDAGRALLPDRRAVPAARAAIARTSTRSGEVFADGAAMLKRPRIESVEIPYGGKTMPALFVHPAPEVAGGKPAPAWCSSTASTSPRRFNISRACPIWSRAASPA